jgi:uncharacterized protein YbbK (DUF523 family)
MGDRPRVGVSRCLLGDRVRYDGGHKHEPSLIETLAAHVEWVPVCPELEVGMGVPREPIQLVTAGDGSRVRLVGVDSGADWTDRMQAWASEKLAALEALGLSGFVLKSRSPSCGPQGVPVGHGEPSPGMFAQALMAAMPDLPVEDEERLRDPEARASFMARVTAHRRHVDLSLSSRSSLPAGHLTHVPELAAADPRRGR